jgi:nucleotide-binding universal stress UspA family protein
MVIIAVVQQNYFRKKVMKNILVPCDFSKPAEEAFKFAVAIAKQSNGAIHVLYVVDITFLRGNSSLDHAYAFNLSFLKEIEKEVDQKFQIMRGRYAPVTMSVTFKHVISSLTPEIESYINANKIDLVLMGTHGAGGATFGSNTEKIVRHSTVPVLAIRTSPEHIKNIVLPLMPDQTDDNFIQAVKTLQNFFQAKIHLLYVNTPLFFKSDPDSTSELNEFVIQKQLDNCTVNVRSDYTSEEGIKHFAKEIKADMVALGTHAWKGLMHFFVGSTAENVVDHLKIPIWTLALK